MTELKPCPFCGGEAKAYPSWSHMDRVYFVRCETCCAEIGKRGTEEEAIEKWNRRVNNE